MDRKAQRVARHVGRRPQGRDRHQQQGHEERQADHDEDDGAEPVSHGRRTGPGHGADRTARARSSVLAEAASTTTQSSTNAIAAPYPNSVPPVAEDLLEHQRGQGLCLSAGTVR